MKLGKGAYGAVGILTCAIAWVTSTVGDLAQGTDKIAVNAEARAVLNALAQEVSKVKDAEEKSELAPDPPKAADEKETPVAQDETPQVPETPDMAPQVSNPAEAVADVPDGELIPADPSELSPSPAVDSDALIATHGGSCDAVVAGHNAMGFDDVGPVGGGGGTGGDSGSGLLSLAAPLVSGGALLLNDDDDDQGRRFATPAR